jgi:hypothetical protein
MAGTFIEPELASAHQSQLRNPKNAPLFCAAEPDWRAAFNPGAVLAAPPGVVPASEPILPFHPFNP